MEFHPIANEYPLLEADLAIIEASMREHGFNPHFPIVTHRGQILDGRTRYLAAERAEVTPQYEAFHGTDAQVRSFAYIANEARRDLGSTFRKADKPTRAAMIQDFMRTGLSYRAIAKKLGIDEKTVRNNKSSGADIPHMEPNVPDIVPCDDIPENLWDAPKPTTEPKRVTGRDGKSYPSTQPRKTPEPTTAGPCAFFDWKRIEQPLGSLIRAVEDCGTNYGRKNFYVGAEDILRQLADILKQWKEKVLKPKEK